MAKQRLFHHFYEQMQSDSNAPDYSRAEQSVRKNYIAPIKIYFCEQCYFIQNGVYLPEL